MTVVPLRALHYIAEALPLNVSPGILASGKENIGLRNQSDDLDAWKDDESVYEAYPEEPRCTRTLKEGLLYLDVGEAVLVISSDHSLARL